jgi:DNA-binding LacI/PurR family transcriptional regulator
MATLADVARHAGVAASTVSYVLSGKRSVSEETRERVAQSIKLLGYQPHAGARALASAKSNVLALVLPLEENHQKHQTQRTISHMREPVHYLSVRSAP